MGITIYSRVKEEVIHPITTTASKPTRDVIQNIGVDNPLIINLYSIPFNNTKLNLLLVEEGCHKF